MDNSKLDKVKEVIRQHYNNCDGGIYNCHNIFDDPTEEIYNEDGVRIHTNWLWRYFEVFGLTKEEFGELKRYYEECPWDDEEEE